MAAPVRVTSLENVKCPEIWVFSSRILHLMTNKINHDDRNAHFTSNFSRFDAMMSSLAKVMGLQSRQKQRPIFSPSPRTWF